VSGTRYDAPQELGTRRFTGLGSKVRILAKSVVVQVFLEDGESGGIVVVEKEFPDPEKGPARGFRYLGETPAVAGAKLIDIARAQLLSGSSKRTASGIISFGRKLTVNPQAFQWEKLRESVLYTDYTELRSSMGLQPPSSLRARRISGSFKVIAIVGTENVRFDPVTQEIRCEFYDSQGERISMIHPYISRSAPGCEQLMETLSQEKAHPVFAAGQIKMTSNGLTIFPASIVIERDGRRTMVQPYLDNYNSSLKGNACSANLEPPVHDPITRWFSSLEYALSEILQLGISKADGGTVDLWKRIASDAGAIGFVRIAQQVTCLAELMEGRMHQINKNDNEICELVLDMLRLLRLARDLF
jgi:hypothetical protein